MKKNILVLAALVLSFMLVFGLAACSTTVDLTEEQIKAALESLDMSLAFEGENFKLEMTMTDEGMSLSAIMSIYGEGASTIIFANTTILIDDPTGGKIETANKGYSGKAADGKYYELSESTTTPIAADGTRGESTTTKTAEELTEEEFLAAVAQFKTALDNVNPVGEDGSEDGSEDWSEVEGATLTGKTTTSGSNVETEITAVVPEEFEGTDVISTYFLKIRNDKIAEVSMKMQEKKEDGTAGDIINEITIKITLNISAITLPSVSDYQTAA